MIDKASLRRQMRQSKAALTPEQKSAESSAVWQHVESTAVFAQAEHVLLYHSLPDELGSHDVIDRWVALGKSVYLPVVIGDDLVVRRYSSEAMQQGEFNIMEPTGLDVDTDVLQLIIVPGVAFDRNGNRLGRGKGYYDRLLSRTKATCIGVCYECQLVPAIPAEPHDKVMHYIITPEGVVKGM
ncbi:MAG: 5-formyltetrahydrofolate cyclo-ligase [Bacteroidaceae bacterium]|nr:5-formyltetrahydrofolate cyclo-ligase [Bacteroidaceae bacterium]